MAPRLWFLLSVFYKCLDILTTSYIVSTKGVEAESNPLVASMMHAYGPIMGLLINAAIFCLLMWILYKHQRVKLLQVSTIAMMTVVSINVTTILI